MGIRSFGVVASGRRRRRAGDLSNVPHRYRRSIVIPLLAIVAGGLSAIPIDVFQGDSLAGAAVVTSRVSLSSSGTQLNGASTNGIQPTPDGRYVSFVSDATNVVSGDTNGAQDVFVRDRVSNVTTREDVATGGAQATTGVANNGTLSNDGRFMAFPSNASNLVAGDTNAVNDVFLRDRSAGTTIRISTSTSGTQGNAASTGSRISGDGNWIAFDSTASNLVSGDTNGAQDAFLWERSTGIVTRIVGPGGAQPNGATAPVDISNDGRYVLLSSTATNLVSGDTNGVGDLFRYDRTTGTTIRVSLSNSGAQLNANSTNGSITANGDAITFVTAASNVVGLDTNGASDLFYRSIGTGATERVSIGNAEEQGNGAVNGGDLSDNGRYVVFSTFATNMVPGDGFQEDTFLRDRGLGTTVRMSNGTDGSPNNNAANGAAISGDGRYITFTSSASNLVANDTNNHWDAFLVDRDAPPPPPGAPQGGYLTSAETRGSGACGSSSNQAQATGYPINTATGNFWHTFEDIMLSGRGINLQLSRTYNSNDAANTGWFGYGWSSSFESSLTLNGSAATVERGNGSQVAFTLQGATWVAPPRAASTLVDNGNGTWTFTCRADDVLTFDAQGRLTARKNLNGDGVTVSYPSGSQVVVTDGAGKSLTLNFTGSHVTAVSDSSSPARSVSYTYDGAGELTDVIDVGGGHATFTYDAAHRMLTYRSPKYFGDTTTSPSPVVTTHYAADGRVDWQTDPLGRQTTFEYSGDPTTQSETVVTDPAGNKVRYVYNYGILTEETRGWYSGDASIWKYEYDPVSTGITKITDPSGHDWLATYDAAGNRLTSTDPLNHTTSATYNAQNRPLTTTDGKNVTTTLTYDAAGNLLTKSTPWLEGPPNTNKVVTFHHDDPSHPGDVTSMTDPAGKTWTYTHDAAGNVLSETDPLNNTKKSCYDHIGRTTATISARGVAAGITCTSAAPAQFTTYVTYNAYGERLTSTDPLGHVSTFTYDLDHHLKTVRDASNNTTTYTFDPAGQATQTQRPDTTITRQDFWPDGQLKSRYDAANNHTDYTYDAQARPTSVADPLGRVTTFSYDPNGNRVTKQDPGGNCGAVPKTGCTTLSYNLANQLAGIDYSDAATPDVTNLTYDADGHRVTMNDGTGASTYTWDSLGRLTSAATPSGTLGYTYDLRDLQTSIVYPGGLGTVTKTYDDASRLSTITDWLNNTTTYGYDADSDQTNRTNPNGTSSSATFDDASRVMAMADAPTATPNSPFASFTYGRDATDKLTSVASTGVPADNHTWTYSTLDQVKTDTAQAFPYTYDTADNLTQVGTGTRQAFDAANQLVSRVGLLGTAGAANSTSATAAVTMPAGLLANDQILLSTTAPANVNVTTPTGFTLVGSWQTGNNASNTKLSVYRKTAAGTESSITVTFSATVAKTVNVAVYRGVDTATPIETSSSATSSTSTVVLPSVTPAAPGDMLVALLGATQGATQSAVWTAPTGMTKQTEQSIASTDGAIADQFLPNAGATGTRTATLGTTGKLVGALLALKPAQGFTYDTRGNRLSSNASGAVTNYGYDQANHLRSIANTLVSSTYDYNGDGLRIYRNGTNASSFTWDTSGGLPTIVKDGSTAYVYGPDGVPIEQINGSVALFYHRDQLGSVRALTSAAGAVVATYSYDAYGNTTGTTGSVANSFGYAGQYKDSESGFLYMRARFYDPATAQFVTRDPLEQITQEPYGYTGGNPLNLTDPSGLCSGPGCWFQTALDVGKEILDDPEAALDDAAKGAGNFGVGVVNAATGSDYCGWDGPGQSWSRNIGSGTFWVETALATAGSGSAAAAGERATVHGAERLAQAGFTEELIAETRAGLATTQADGASVFIREVSPGRFDFIVEGERGVITAHRGWSLKSVTRLAENYGWEGWPP